MDQGEGYMMAVPVLSIVFMAVSLILSVGLPVALFLFWRKKYSLRVAPMLFGAAAFVLFALILEQILHVIVLRPDANGAIALMSRPYLYMLYGCFAAGIFEETARFISFNLLKKKYTGVGTGLSYGIGHGGVEAVIIVGLAMVSNIIASVMVNLGIGADTIPLQAAESLSSAASHMFLIGGLERVMSIAIQISLSVFVYYAVTAKGKWWLYPAAVLIHAVVNFPAALMQAGVISNIYMVEGIILIESVALCAAAFFAYKKFEGKLNNAMET